MFEDENRDQLWLRTENHPISYVFCQDNGGYLTFGCTVPMIADHEISLTGEHMYHSGFERS